MDYKGDPDNRKVNLADISASNFQSTSFEASFDLEGGEQVLQESWPAEKLEKVEAWIQHLANLPSNELRCEFHEIVNPSSKGLHVAFTTQLKYIRDKYAEFLADKEKCKRLFEDRKQLAKGMHGYALGYLRHLRAFNFQPCSDSLSQLIFDFVSMLIDDPFESLTKLIKLKEAFRDAVRHMTLKFENDTLLQQSEYVESEVKNLEDCYLKFKTQVDARLNEARAQDMENKSRD